MDCIHCGKCIRHCDFLQKYQMDLEVFSKHPELAYHCFLCGECTAGCPKGIDGRKIALELRRQRVEQVKGDFAKLPEAKAQRMLVLEKKNYLFRNYRHSTAGSVLFPGCNFPSFYPETTAKLVKLLWEKAGIGVVMDCCGKPIAELGMEKESKAISKGLSERLHRAGVTELVVLCPNCYAFLKEHLDIPVVSIYQKLRELGLAQPLKRERFPIYLPCPDRESREMLDSFLPLLQGEIEEIQGIQCCGLGGCAAAYEPELSAGFGQKLNERELPEIYTYCASCAGNFSRRGCSGVKHLLPELLGAAETLPQGARSLLNRARWKLR